MALGNPTGLGQGVQGRFAPIRQMQRGAEAALGRTDTGAITPPGGPAIAPPVIRSPQPTRLPPAESLAAAQPNPAGLADRPRAPQNPAGGPLQTLVDRIRSRSNIRG